MCPCLRVDGVWKWAWACQIYVAVYNGSSFSSLLLFSPCFCQRADLEAGVTDDGLRALASARCGKELMSLTLFSECCCVLVFELMVCGNGRESGHAECVLLSVTGAPPLLLSCCLLALPPRRSGSRSDGLRAGCAGLCRVRGEADVTASLE